MAFITNQGLFEPRVMFFGLTNSPATFQTIINAIFAEELHENWLTIYMDDILVHTTKDVAAHREKVHKVLQKLRQHDLYLKHQEKPPLVIRIMFSKPEKRFPKPL